MFGFMAEGSIVPPDGIPIKFRRGRTGEHEARKRWREDMISPAWGLSLTGDQQRSISSQWLSSTGRDSGRLGLSP